MGEIQTSTVWGKLKHLWVMTAMILFSAELYLQYMFLDWRVSNWSGAEALGAARAGRLAMAAALSFQPLCAWILIRTRLTWPAFIATQLNSDQPIVWRYILALSTTLSVTFVLSLVLYLIAGVPYVGDGQNEIASWLQGLYR